MVIAKATKDSKPVLQLRKDIGSSNLHLKIPGGLSTKFGNFCFLSQVNGRHNLKGSAQS